jgi:heme A synthase
MPYRHALLLAALALIVVATGSVGTSARLGESGGLEAASRHGHYAAAAVAGLLAAWLGVRLSSKGEYSRVGWTVLAAFFAVGLPGALGSLGVRPAAAGMVHAWLAPLFAAAAAAAAVMASPDWSRGPDPVKDHGWPSLRSLSTLVPLLLIAQIGLGAAFRHRSMSVLPHLVGAMLVALLILILAVFVMNQFPGHRSLRPWAVALLAIALTQVMLGLATFLAGFMVAESSPVAMGLTLAHVTAGSLTMAASVVLAVQIRRHVRPKDAPEATSA